MASRGPNKAEIEALRRTLRVGQQKVITPGVYVRLNANGTLGFQAKLRLAGAGSRAPGRTFDNWEDADREYRRRLEQKENGSAFAWREQQRRLPIERYAVETFWRDRVEECGPLTLLEIRSVLQRDVLPYWKGWTLEQIVSAGDDAMLEYRDWLKKRKTVDGQLRTAAYDKALKVAGRVLNHARRRGIVDYNPFASVPRLHGTSRGRREGGRPIEPREARHPREIERIRLVMRGRGIFLYQNRLLVSLAAWEGLRPSEILYLRHENWRDENGPLRQLEITGALKDVAGHLREGPTKTHEPRSPYLWLPVAEELEFLYQLQGCPPLDSLVFPNRLGAYRRWDNFRDDNWYRCLHEAGLAKEPSATASGAFDFYSTRHTCATVMFHAVKPGEDGGHYTPKEISRQLGNSQSTLQDVYEHVLDDQHGVAGLTMEQIIRRARREVWGPLPGDPDHLDVELTLPEAARLTGLSLKALDARAATGSIPGVRRQGRNYIVTGTSLLLARIATPAQLGALTARR